MNIFLAIQNSYHNVQLALFKRDCLLDQRSIDKKKASKLLIPTVAELLDQQQITLANLPFIAVNQGPAPFTTLRVVIASMNGISFSSNIPLIGVDAFDAMHTEWQDNAYPTTIILFNAFSGEVYFAMERPENPTAKGYQHIDALLGQCTRLSGTIRFIGNGVELYREKIQNLLGTQAYLPEPMPDYSSIEKIALLGYQQWQEGNRGSHQLLPLYLKKHPAELNLAASSSHR